MAVQFELEIILAGLGIIVTGAIFYFVFNKIKNQKQKEPSK